MGAIAENGRRSLDTKALLEQCPRKDPFIAGARSYDDAARRGITGKRVMVRFKKREVSGKS